MIRLNAKVKTSQYLLVFTRSETWPRVKSLSAKEKQMLSLTNMLFTILIQTKNEKEKKMN